MVEQVKPPPQKPNVTGFPVKCRHNEMIFDFNGSAGGRFTIAYIHIIHTHTPPPTPKTHTWFGKFINI